MNWSTSNKSFSDRKWIVLISVALVLETIWLLSELNIITLPFLNKTKKERVAVEAGYIVQAQVDIKKRAGDSLIWEVAKPSDILYYQDSVLTLTNSTATLYLKDQTELKMSENTLVTLEEPEKLSNAEIRLRFSKGDIKARNPYAQTQIQSADWIVNLEKGAEVALRKNDTAYEFEILAGKAILKTEAGLEETLTEDNILKLNDDKKIEKIEKSSELKWAAPKPERVYTFNNKALIPLEWQGEAQKLKIQRQGQAEEVREVLKAAQSTEVELPLGSYEVRLTDNKGLSSAKTIEVWKAPKIILKKPLPRDRIQIGEAHEFVWMSDAKVKAYELKMGNGQNITVNENYKTLKFDKEQDLTWSIEAVDEEGYRIPALYESKVYLRSDALAAPKLKQPKIIEIENEIQPQIQPEQNKPQIPNNDSKPSSLFWRNPSLINFIFSQLTPANAQVLRKKQVVFEWEVVEGANQYIIEISSDPEFKNPEVIETINKSQFIWKKYNPTLKYFWRVASGNSNGRMGLFSEPIPLDLIIDKTDLRKKENLISESTAPVVPAKTKSDTNENNDEKNASNAIENNSNLLTSAAPLSEQQEVNSIDLRPRWSLGLGVGYKSADISGDTNSRIKLGGLNPFNLDLKYQSDSQNMRMYFFDFNYSVQQWKSDLNNNLIQSDLNLNESIISWRTSLKNSNWQYGLSAHQSFYAQRENLGVKAQEIWLVGFELVKIINPNWHLTAGYVVDSDFNEIKLGLNYQNYFNSNNNSKKYYYGLQSFSYLQSGSYGSGQQTQVQFLLGLAWF